MSALYIGRSSYSRIIRAFAHEYEQITATVQASLHTHFQLPLPMLVCAAAQFVSLAPCTVGALSRGGPGCSLFGAHLACPPFRQHWDASLALHRLARLATWPSTRAHQVVLACVGRWLNKAGDPSLQSAAEHSSDVECITGETTLYKHRTIKCLYTRYAIVFQHFPLAKCKQSKTKPKVGSSKKKKGGGGVRGIEAEATG